VVFEFNSFWLARAEGDDAADGIVGRNTYGHAISRDNFNAEAAHAAAELGQHFVAGVALNPVEAPAMDGHNRTLHVDEIVLAQTASNPFIFLDNNCATLSGLPASGFRLQAYQRFRLQTPGSGLQHEELENLFEVLGLRRNPKPEA
jgi:hypothetical protein